MSKLVFIEDFMPALMRYASVLRSSVWSQVAQYSTRALIEDTASQPWSRALIKKGQATGFDQVCKSSKKAAPITQRLLFGR